jgi:hypothetical protein
MNNPGSLKSRRASYTASVSRRVVLVSLLIVGGAVAAVVLLRGGDGEPSSSRSPEAASNPDPTPESAVPRSNTPISRERPRVEPAPAVAQPSLPFEQEVLDDDFAARRTAEVRLTVADAIASAAAGGAVRLAEVECRSQRCRLTLVAEGDTGGGLSQVLARLEDERGFYGKASELALHDAVMGADGTPQQVSMTLLFARD